MKQASTFLENFEMPDLASYNQESNSIFIQSITFDNQKIIDINYDFKAIEAVSAVLGEVKLLKEKINVLEHRFHSNALLAQGTLKSMWEGDDVWDEL